MMSLLITDEKRQLIVGQKEMKMRSGCQCEKAGCWPIRWSYKRHPSSGWVWRVPAWPRVGQLRSSSQESEVYAPYTSSLGDVLPWWPGCSWPLSVLSRGRLIAMLGQLPDVPVMKVTVKLSRRRWELFHSGHGEAYSRNFCCLGCSISLLQNTVSGSLLWPIPSGHTFALWIDYSQVA